MNENSVALFNKRLHQQHNVCNIFYMMERLKLIQKDEESCGIAAANQNHQPPYNLAGYDSLGLPDLPPRFHHVHKPKGWYVPGSVKLLAEGPVNWIIFHRKSVENMIGKCFIPCTCASGTLATASRPQLALIDSIVCTHCAAPPELFDCIQSYLNNERK